MHVRRIVSALLLGAAAAPMVAAAPAHTAPAIGTPAVFVTGFDGPIRGARVIR